jgi:ribosomal protein S18 acetylase RimI-like enzyme
VERAGVFSAGEIDVAEELAQDAALQQEDSHYHFILAEDEGVLAGYSCFGRIPLTDERYDLYWLVTEKKLCRKGVARMVLSQTEVAIKALGGKAIYAETSSRDIYKAAWRCYESAGFALAATVADFYSKGDDKLLYVKWL